VALIWLLTAFGFWAPPTDDEFVRHPDIAYRDDKDADKVRHTLDLYVPKGKTGFPVVIFVHGGAWRSGDKSLYAPLGMSLAADGIGCVIINYRLSPAVQHPAHVEDVARAFAWTFGKIGDYGGDRKKLFLCGHSAGGHLVSLLATDPAHLKAVKCVPGDIKGVATFSGVYDLVGGIAAADPDKSFDAAFGSKEAVRKSASPLAHATGKHPPFLVAFAARDYFRFPAAAKEMAAALEKGGTSVTLVPCADRDHYSIIVQFAHRKDPLNETFRAFVVQCCK
jgi:acetyl esterase/lipase